MAGRPVRQKRWPTTLAVALCWTALGCGGGSRPEHGQASLAAGPRHVVALGKLEPAGGVISISAIPGERLKKYAAGIDEGVVVAAGAELAQLASFDLRQKQLDAVQARLDLAKKQRQHEIAVADAALQQSIAGEAEAEAKYREVQSQRQKLDNLGEAAAIAEDDYRRLAELREKDHELVTEQELRRQHNQSDRAAREYEAADASYGPSLEAAKKAVEAAHVNVEVARQNADMAKTVDQTVAIDMEKKVAEETRDQSVLRAPDVPGGSRSFTVLKVFIRPGEFVTQIPILQLGDLTQMACIAEVYEADAKEIVVGQKATIRSPAFSGKYADGGSGGAGGIEGKVVRVGAVVNGPELLNRNPLAPSDRSVVEVRIDVDPADKAATDEAKQRIGLQVTVEFGEKPAAPASGQPASATKQ